MGYHGPEIELGEAKNRFWANSRLNRPISFPFLLCVECCAVRRRACRLSAEQTTGRFGLNYKWLVHRDCRAL
jgi:hypothetical protein